MRCYLLIGGNVGNRFELLAKACELIEGRVGRIVEKSKVYETAPWGFESDQGFLNMALAVESGLKPLEVLDRCLEVERLLGRERKLGQQYSSRTMDVDIIFADALVIESPRLVVPHPRVQERRFALVPLSGIAPNFIHPVLKKTVLQLLEACPDRGAVEEYHES